MQLQKTILTQYMLVSGKPTLKKISQDTGIQLTRIFRIFNGSTMKLSEYEIFKKRVREKSGLTEDLETIAFECSLLLSSSAVKELETFLKRKIETWRLLQIQKESQQNNLSA